MRTGPISPKRIIPPHQPIWLSAALMPIIIIVAIIISVATMHVIVILYCHLLYYLPLILIGYISERTMYAIVLYTEHGRLYSVKNKPMR